MHVLAAYVFVTLSVFPRLHSAALSFPGLGRAGRKQGLGTEGHFSIWQNIHLIHSLSSLALR